MGYNNNRSKTDQKLIEWLNNISKIISPHIDHIHPHIDHISYSSYLIFPSFKTILLGIEIHQSFRWGLKFLQFPSLAVRGLKCGMSGTRSKLMYNLFHQFDTYFQCLTAAASLSTLEALCLRFVSFNCSFIFASLSSHSILSKSTFSNKVSNSLWSGSTHTVKHRIEAIIIDEAVVSKINIPLLPSHSKHIPTMNQIDIFSDHKILLGLYLLGRNFVL